MKKLYVINLWLVGLLFWLSGIETRLYAQTTVDLTTHQPTAAPPSGATLEWHNALPVSAANRISGPQVTSAAAGVYYAVYNYGGSPVCYSQPSYLRVLTNTCPSATVDLSVAVDLTSLPANTTVTYHSSATPTAGNQLASTTVTAGQTEATYYAAYKTYDAGNSVYCYSNVSPIVVAPTTCCSLAVAPAPALNKTTVGNACPVSTVSLAGITASNLPVSTTLTWHIGTPATTANRLSDVSALGAGTYYAAFYDPANGCYSGSTTPVTATISNCCSVTTAPVLSANSAGNTCPVSTADLSGVTANNTPGGATLTWHTGTPATAANRIASVNAVGAGTYYAAFYDAGSGCYSGAATAPLTVAITSCCSASVAPTLSVAGKTNTCPATTVDLSSITAGNTPGGATLTWHTGTPATAANRIASVNAVGAGTYYAAFYDARSGCYSGAATTPLSVSITTCCSASVVPMLSAAGKSNVCPATTIDLSGITASNTPGGTTLTWHTGTPATAANEIGSVSSVAPGTYYAAFKGANACYGPTQAVSAGLLNCSSPFPIIPPVATVCDYSAPASISLTVSSEPAGMSKLYLLVDMANGQIVATNATTPGFANIGQGNYYAVTAYYTTTATISGATVGNTIDKVYLNDAADCLKYSSPLALKVCGSCDRTISGPVSITFTATPGSGTGLTTTYVLVDEATNVISQTSASPAFSNVAAGSYAVVAMYSYGPASLTVGSSLYSSVVSNTNCTGTSNSIHYKLCACNATVAPGLTLASVSNSCPAVTVDLNSLTATNLPGGTTMTWHSGATATAANQLSNVSALTAGTYYAAFYDAANTCYSGTATTPVTALVAPCSQLNCAGTGLTTGTFVAGISGTQTGTLTVGLTGAAAGTLSLNVAGPAGFASVPSPFVASLTAGQQAVSVPIVYNGSGSAGVYSLTVTSGGFANVCTVPVTVFPPVPCTSPVPGQIVTAGSSSLVAGSSNNSFSYVGGNSNNQIRWFVVPSAGASPANGTGTSTGNITFLNAGGYQVIFEETNTGLPTGCNIPNTVQSSLDVFINAVTNPCASPGSSSVVVSPSSAAILTGGSASFSLAGGQPYQNVQWQVIPATGASPATGTGTNPTVTFSQEGLYRVVFTMTNAGDLTCTPVQKVSSALVMVGMNPCASPSPVSVINSSASSGTALSGTTHTFQATGGVPGQMIWKVYPTTGVSSVSGTGNTAVLTFSKPGDYVVTFIATNSGLPVGCTKPTAIASNIGLKILNQAPVVTPDVNTFIPGILTVGNVLTNDKDPEGGGLTATVVGTPPAGFTLTPDGSYTYSPPGSQTTSVTVIMQVCDTATPPQCATSTLTLVPAANPTAANDAPVALGDAPHTTAGTPVTANVLANDRDPEGLPLSNPTIVSPPTHGTAVVNPDGTVSYTPTPGFTGIDQLVYRVCDTDTPPACSTAPVSFVVEPAPPAGVTNVAPSAVDDQILTTKNTSATGSLAANDSDGNGGQTLGYTLLNGPAHGSLVVTPNGSYTYTPATNYIGTDNFTYQVCDNGSPVLCSTATAYATIYQPQGLPVLPKVWLQGALFSVTATNGIMRDDLRVKGVLPATSPYTNYTTLTAVGPVSNTTAVFSVTGVNAIVDWVFVELRSPTNMSLVVDSRPALLQRDGDIVDVDGVNPITFSQATAGNYYVSVRHRNHLGVMTATPVALSATGTAVDFRNPATPTYRISTAAVNQSQVTVTQGVAMWAGNVLSDKSVIYQGTNNDVSAISVQVKGPLNNTGSPLYVLNGYFSGDVNLDGRTIYQGTGNDGNYIYQNVTRNHPGNVAGQNIFVIREQLP